MPDMTPGFRKALGLYQSIVGGASEGMTTADIWSALQDVADRSGQTLSGISATDVSRLRAAAGAELRATANLADAPFGSTIDASMISTAPYARDPLVMDAAPRFNVTISLNTLSEGVSALSHYVVSYTGFLPPTTDQLLNDLEAQAAELGAQYGFEAGDIVGVSIVAV